MMTKTIAWLVAIIGSVMVFTAHAASNGVAIDMSGTVVATSCDVNAADTTQTVFIGSFGSNTFHSVGDVSASADLRIRLTDCSSGIAGATVTFSGTPDSNNGKLLALSDTSGARAMASGVGVEILDSSRKSLAINTASESQPLVEGDNNILTFYLRYQATKMPVTAGNASAVMYFDLSYQ